MYSFIINKYSFLQMNKLSDYQWSNIEKALENNLFQLSDVKNIASVVGLDSHGSAPAFVILVRGVPGVR